MLLYRYPIFVSIGYKDGARLLIKSIGWWEFLLGAFAWRFSKGRQAEPQKCAGFGQCFAFIRRNQGIAQGRAGIFTASVAWQRDGIRYYAAVDFHRARFSGACRVPRRLFTILARGPPDVGGMLGFLFL